VKYTKSFAPLSHFMQVFLCYNLHNFVLRLMKANVRIDDVTGRMTEQEGVMVCFKVLIQ
jgi:hypothetical protein